ncbi:MAG: C-terminal binding protein [Candidatus Omnitrophica bacterium]|nr:C-terminal binding protein [Candidatus Omnitrophota bacterium]
MNKCLVVNINGSAHSIFKEDRERLRKLGAEYVELRKYQSSRKVDELLKRADAILFTDTTIDISFLERLKRCRIIIRFGTGLDNIDIEAATENGIMVSRVIDFCTQEVSNHTIMLLLACGRKLKEFSNLLLMGKLPNNFSPVGSIEGETLGLVGFGKIARSVAMKAKAFGMKIISYDPYVKRNDFEQSGVNAVSLNTLLKRSDYISLHCPLVAETYHLIGEKELRLMKKTAYLINTSRGKLVDEKALIKALRERLIAGAGLDVFEKEPPDVENPLLHMENVICTPHCAYYSDKSVSNLKKKVVDELIRALAGKIPENLYNPEVLCNINLRAGIS